MKSQKLASLECRLAEIVFLRDTIWRLQSMEACIAHAPKLDDDFLQSLRSYRHRHEVLPAFAYLALRLDSGQREGARHAFMGRLRTEMAAMTKRLLRLEARALRLAPRGAVVPELPGNLYDAVNEAFQDAQKRSQFGTNVTG